MKSRSVNIGGKKSMLSNNFIVILFLSGVSVFTVSNTTKDDLFLILAGLLHGPDCDILTSDYLRQHRYALGYNFVLST